MSWLRGILILGVIFVSGAAFMALRMEGASRGIRERVADVVASFQPRPAESEDLSVSPPNLPGEARLVGFGHVDVEGGVIPLAPAAGGIITEISVREGERIDAGAVILKLQDGLANAGVALAESAVAQAKVKLDQARRAPERHAILLKEQQQAINVAQSRADSLERHERDVRSLEKRDLATGMETRNLRDRVIEARAALEAESLKLEELKLEEPQVVIRLAEAAVTQAVAQRTQAEEHLRLLTLKAPVAGTVLRLNVRTGQAIGPNLPMPALLLCPDTPRLVRCEFDQEFAGRIVPGMRAEIVADGEKPRIWKGKVRSIAGWIAPRRSVLDEPFQKNDVRTLETLVEFDAPAPSLRIGERLRVTLLAPDESPRSSSESRIVERTGMTPGERGA
jgi:multidrug resistance efflux pump